MYTFTDEVNCCELLEDRLAFLDSNSYDVLTSSNCKITKEYQLIECAIHALYEAYSHECYRHEPYFPSEE